MVLVHKYKCLACALALALMAFGFSTPACAQGTKSSPHCYTFVFAEDSAPYASLNSSGEPEGILVDYWRAWAKGIGVAVQVVLVPQGQDIRALEDGFAEVHMGLAYSMQDAGRLLFGPAVLDVETGLFAANRLQIDRVEDIGDNPVGVIRGSHAASFLKDLMPSIRLMEFNGAEDLLSGIFRGQVNIFCGDASSMPRELLERGAGEAYSLVEILFRDSLRPAVIPHNRAMLKTLEMGFQHLDPNVLDDIRRRWADRQSGDSQLVRALLLWISMVLVAFVVTYSVAITIRCASRGRKIGAVEKENEQFSGVLRRIPRAVNRDILQPMNELAGMLSMIPAKGLAEDRKQYQETLDSTARRILSAVHDLRDFVRAETGQLRLESVDFDLYELVRSALSVVKGGVRHKHLSLELDIAPTVKRCVMGDPARLMQVLVNLLSNAVRYTERGAVIVSLLAVSDAGDTAKGQVVEFRVKDTGIGMDPKRAESLFEAFAKDGETGPPGLGLPVCARLVQLMGGNIRVRTGPGKGSMFMFTARFGAGDADSCLPVLDEGVKVARSGLRFLLVMENAGSTLVMRMLLEHMGNHCQVLPNAPDILDVLDKYAFDVLVLDCPAIVMDSLAVTRNIRMGGAGVRNSDIPILGILHEGSVDAAEACYAEGMNEVLMLPLGYERLSAAVNQLPLRDSVPDGLLMSQSPDKPMVLNLEETLGREVDDDALFHILSVTREELNGVLAELDEAVNADDCSRIRGLAHTVKSICRSVGAEVCADTATFLELAAKDERFRDIAELARRLRGDLRDLENKIKSMG